MIRTTELLLIDYLALLLEPPKESHFNGDNCLHLYTCDHFLLYNQFGTLFSRYERLLLRLFARYKRLLLRLKQIQLTVTHKLNMVKQEVLFILL